MLNSLDKTSREIDKLNPKKAGQATNILNKVIKENKDLISFYVYYNFDKSLSNSLFPTPLKNSDVRPTYKKDNKTDKTNYRPISILSNISKVYEKLIFNQLYSYLDNIFSKLQCSFHKGHNAQY